MHEEEDKIGDKVRDHCHITVFLTAAHPYCNLNVKQKFLHFLTLASHNTTEYGSQFFIKELMNRNDLSVTFETTPKTDERFTSFAYGRFLNIHSLNFMLIKLDTFS